MIFSIKRNGLILISTNRLEECWINNFEKTIDNYTIFYYPNSKVVSIRKELPEQVVLIYYFDTQDRLKITLFDKINNTTSTTNYSKENYPEIYERDLTILDNEYSLLGGN